MALDAVEGPFAEWTYLLWEYQWAVGDTRRDLLSKTDGLTVTASRTTASDGEGPFGQMNPTYYPIYDARISFDCDADLDRAARQIANDIAVFLEQHPEITLLHIEGSCGMSEDCAKSLDLQRAFAVKLHLVSKGINPERLLVAPSIDGGGPDGLSLIHI